MWERLQGTLSQPATVVYGPLATAGPDSPSRRYRGRLRLLISSRGGRLLHSAIVLIENWYGVDQTERQKFAATVSKIEGGPAVQKLDENLWQIDFRESPAPLGLFIAACEKHHLGYRVLACEQPPQWSPPLPISRDAPPAR
jgi:hypothetical protein